MSLIDEIRSQPAVLARALQENGALIDRVAAAVGGVKSVFIAARGSSDNAARYAKYALGIHNRLPVTLAAPSIFTCYGVEPGLDGALVAAISQSGQSPDIVEVVRAGRRQGRPTLAITNRVESPLAQAAEYVIPIRAGPEHAVAATKTYTAQLLAIAMLSCRLAGDSARQEEILQLPGWVEAMLALEPTVEATARRWERLDRCVVLGRGYNYATAFEWALKLKEMAYAAAEPYSSADFLHGPIAMLSGGFRVLAMAPSGAVYQGVGALLTRLKRELGAELLVISDREEALALADAAFRLPAEVPEWLTPIVGIIAAQLFVYHLAQARGLDPDQPRRLDKVTRTI